MGLTLTGVMGSPVTAYSKAAWNVYEGGLLAGIAGWREAVLVAL
jgi:hypothetical protein